VQPVFDDRSEPVQAAPPAASDTFVIVSEGRGGGALDQPRTHKVRKGETLAQVAKRYYGDDSEWRRIYSANRDVLKDPNRLKPGVTLRIP
jgi:nucleoid-associated protein YgaU